MFSAAPEPPAPSRLSRVLLVCALLLFGLPLYFGLGRSDLENDEAGYSYSVDRALKVDAWVTPHGIYSDGPFFEKPPLKMWIVAGGITLGLPHDEFGLRFWDPLFAIIAFAYVFALGRRLAGPICGFVALLILFTFTPLVFEHGLRTNNMEAGLVLCYAGGMYHFFRWTESRTRRSRWGHAFGVAGWFTFGFMLKFVAAFFLPFAAVVAYLWQRGVWKKLRAGLADWLLPVVASLAAIAPWFVYEAYEYRAEFWRQIFGENIVTRFTSYLNPEHVKPWYYYFTTSYSAFMYSSGLLLVAAGLVLLAIRAWHGRPWLARLILVWGIVPIGLISLGTSKLYHYAYPMIPACALAGGLAAAVWLDASNRFLDSLSPAGPSYRAIHRRPWLRRTIFCLGCLLLLVGLWNVCVGPVLIAPGGVRLFRSTSPTRAVLGGLVLLLISHEGRLALRLATVALLCAAAPVAAYRGTVGHLFWEVHPIRTVRDCMVSQIRSGAATFGGVYVPDTTFVGHPYYYYLRSTGPWIEGPANFEREVVNRLFVPGKQTALIIDASELPGLEARVEAWIAKDKPDVPPLVDRQWWTLVGISVDPGAVILLPGPFTACVAPAVKAGGQLYVADANAAIGR